MSLATALPGTIARFKMTTTGPDGSRHANFVDRPVVAWIQDDDGFVEGLIISDPGRLTIAKSLSNFEGYAFDDRHAVQIMPAEGWSAVYTIDGQEEPEPLVGWALTASGDVRGLLEQGGYVDVVDERIERQFVRFEPTAPPAPVGQKPTHRHSVRSTARDSVTAK